jgi:hypothetical protein
MEEKSVDRLGQLACKAIIAGASLKSIGASATSLDLEIEPDFGETKEPEPLKPFSTSYQVTGVSSGENVYLMDVTEWVSHYSTVVGQQGFVCSVNNSLQNVISENYQLSLVLDGSEADFSPQTESLVILPSVVPYRIPLAGEMLDFCLENKLTSYLESALNLISRFFQTPAVIYLRLEHDPDFDEQWFVLDFTVNDSIEKVLDAHDQYTDQWVAHVPWPERDKIRISYNIE